MPQHKIIFLVGPTAVGKTEVALALAKRLKGEIVSCDSMQIYKGVSIASNKPSAEQLKKILHHLIGFISVTKNFDVANFRRRAAAVIRKIQRENKIPIVAGGSGLYMQVLLDGIFEGGGTDTKIHRRLENLLEEYGSTALYQELKKIDPPAAAKIHPHDSRRLIRALEVFETRKEPISKLQKMRRGLWGQYDIMIFALQREREELYKRINARVEQMFERGIVKEIKDISGKKLSPTAQGMIGLKEISGYLRGEYDLERAKYLLKRNTRHFAKRQLTWFRKDKRVNWIHIKEDDTTERIVEAISHQSSAISQDFFADD